MQAKIEGFDSLKMLWLIATFGPALPRAVTRSAHCEVCEFTVGKRDPHDAHNFMGRWRTLYAFRPSGYRRWFRPDLCAWVADPLERFRDVLEAQALVQRPARYRAPVHDSYVRRASA